MNEPHGSVNPDDIYDDLDSFVNPEADCTTESSNISDIAKSAPSQSPSTSNFKLNEDQLKKEEMILYLDLVVTEIDNQKTLSNLKTEYISLKKETDMLRKSLSEKDEKIAQLTAEVTTLKKNICSLYKTAKSEIDQKDALLQEAHKKIDWSYSQRGKSMCENERSVAESSQCRPSTSRTSSMPTQDFKQPEAHWKSKEDQYHKNNRKRSYETPESENQSFKRQSFNRFKNHSKWNRNDSKDNFSHQEFGKHKHLPSRDVGDEKCNNNYKDRRKPTNNQTNHNKEKIPERKMDSSRS